MGGRLHWIIGGAAAIDFAQTSGRQKTLDIDPLGE